MKYVCAHCGKAGDKDASAVNRALSIRANLYCDRTCAGLARRRKVTPTEAERKEAKRLYDARRREELADEIKAQKAAHHLKTYDPEKARVERQKRMPKHVEYCRRPEYKVKKAEYDKRRRFEEYGPFAEVAMLLADLEKEISTRASRYEIYIANGRFTRSAQRRRRELWQSIKRN